MFQQNNKSRGDGTVAKTRFSLTPVVSLMIGVTSPLRSLRAFEGYGAAVRKTVLFEERVVLTRPDGAKATY